MGSVFKVAAMYSSLPCLSLSRLCGLELGIHLTANGPHDDATPTAAQTQIYPWFSGVRFVDGKASKVEGGKAQTEAITFGFSPLFYS